MQQFSETLRKIFQAATAQLSKFRSVSVQYSALWWADTGKVDLFCMEQTDKYLKDDKPHEL